LTKSQYLSEQLKQELAKGHLAPAEKFLSIPQVSDQFRVSPATAYKVVSGLVREGFLTSRRGKGYYVAKRPGASDLNPVFRSVIPTTKTLLLVNDYNLSSPPAKAMAGIQDVCQEWDCRMEMISVEAENLLERASGEDVAGVIFCKSYCGNAQVRHIAKPKICIGHWADPADGVISFVADAEQAAFETVRHLCGLGHERIAVLSLATTEGITDIFIGQLVAGFRRGAQAYGVGWSDDLVDLSDRPQREHVKGFVETYRDKGITAVFVPQWPTLSILLQEMRRCGLDVPGDLSVVGYGDDPTFTPLLEPRMVHFDLFIRQMTRKAAEMILAHERDGAALPETRFVTFSVELLPGDSTCSLYRQRAGGGGAIHLVDGQSEV
jgi:DNA-binding LacI/PurR family transcriptional regulator